MKKLLILLLSICMIGSIGTFASCTDSTEASSSVETVEDKVRSEAELEVTFAVYEKYGYFPYVVNITNFSESYIEDKYYVSGKYTIRDNYGDNYTGKFDLTIIYDPDTYTCKVTEEKIQSAYKD